MNLLQELNSKFNFQDYYLQHFIIFAPQHVLSGETNSIELFPIEIENIESINSEYRASSDISELQNYADLSITDFWKKVSSIKNTLNETLFANIYRIVQDFL